MGLTWTTGQELLDFQRRPSFQRIPEKLDLRSFPFVILIVSCGVHQREDLKTATLGKTAKKLVLPLDSLSTIPSGHVEL